VRLVFNFFEEIFAPGRRHVAEERKRLELTRVDLGVGDPGRGPIDLSSGKVVVRAPDHGGPEPDREAPPEPDRAPAPEEERGPTPEEERDPAPEAAPHGIPGAGPGSGPAPKS